MFSIPALHLMVDIETLSTEPNAAILSIGAVSFHIPQLPNDAQPLHFYAEIDPDTIPTPPFHISQETVDWWATQKHSPQGTEPLLDVLARFNAFLVAQDWATVWANSPSFDLIILKHAFQWANLEWPIPFWNERDVRTVNNVILKNPKLPVAHHALHDCYLQVIRVQLAFEKLVALEKPASKPRLSAA